MSASGDACRLTTTDRPRNLHGSSCTVVPISRRSSRYSATSVSSASSGTSSEYSSLRSAGYTRGTMCSGTTPLPPTGGRQTERATRGVGAPAGVLEPLGVHAADRGLGVRHGVHPGDRRAQDGQRPGGDVARAPAAVAVAAEAEHRALGRDGAGLRPAAVRLADGRAELDL